MEHSPGTPPRPRREFLDQLKNLFVVGADDFKPGSGGQERRYRALRRYVVLSTAFVSLAPLLVITVLSYRQYERAYRTELFDPIARLTSTTKQTVDFFLAERRSALEMIVRETPFPVLAEADRLRRTLANLASSFGGFVDLGLIDQTGRQRAYEGPYSLLGRNYADQSWFSDVQQRGVHVSGVFLGYRGIPHFVIAVKHLDESGAWYVLRATVDSEELNRRIRGPGVDDLTDIFLVDGQGLLQSPSRLYGKALQPVPEPLRPPEAGGSSVGLRTVGSEPFVVGYAAIERSPFTLMLLHRPREQMATWQTIRSELVIFFGVSVVLILSVIWVSSTYMMKRVRDADRRREASLHEVEYTNKMATIGRLAAGVAHEINNPLAIINEKAGLLQDFIDLGDQFPRREKVASLVSSIISSVERASRVTHRLLGFSRHVDVRCETIDLEALIHEVLGFLEREASYRGVDLVITREADLPAIESDRGQLQQVFLNIVNNALAAVKDRVGRIDIAIGRTGTDQVRVTITDNGEGIEQANLSKIFEPFFTTKKGYGTGLGLSVTYGIIQKLGGAITVESEPGAWTTFTVTLPITSCEPRDQAHGGPEDPHRG